MWSKVMVCWGGAACRDADSAGALRAPEGTGCLGLWAAAAWPGEDDLGASGGLPARVPARDREPEEVLNLNRLPNELLQEVLSYLPPSTLLRHCRPVCRRWRDVVDGWDLWPSILPWKHPDPWPVIRTCLPPADAPGPCILGRFCERRPIGRNLLRNSQSPRGLVNKVVAQPGKTKMDSSASGGCHPAWVSPPDPKPGEAVDVDQLPNELLQEMLSYLPPSTLLQQCRQGQDSAATKPGEETMCTSASTNWPVGVCSLKPEPEEILGPNQLPIEMLQEVLSYLPPRTLLRHCRPVCRRWRDVVDGWDLWRSILPWRHPDLWPVIRTCLPPADAPGPCILGRFCERRPIGRNLLRKPRGLGGFQKWTVLSREDDWTEKENLEVMPRAYMQTSFLSSYRRYHKKQVLDLEKEGLWRELLDSGNIEICVSDWRNDRQGIDCIYQLTVHLLDASQAILDHFSPLPFPIRRSRNSVSSRASHVFCNIEKGVRFVSFERHIWDLEFRNEHYRKKALPSDLLAAATLRQLLFYRVEVHGSPATAAWPGEDDLWASRGLPASVATPDTEPKEELDLNRLPNELLQEVLSYLPPSTLLRHCRLVCRRWRDVVDGWDLWRSILPREHPDLWPVIRTCLPPADAPGPCILGRFCERRPIGRNLLRNSQSSRGLGFLNQTVPSAEAARGAEENARVGPLTAYRQRRLLSSYRWCQQKQVLDLEKEGLWRELLDSGNIEIRVSDWWFDDRDADCLYRLIVQLLDANQAVLHHFSPLPFPSNQLGNDVFFEVNHVFSNLKKGVRFVSFEHWIRDFEFSHEQHGNYPLHSSMTVRVRQALPDHAFQALGPLAEPSQY
ncbi:hypothetical protein R6Z07F_013259 [Ovis aries]